jgi:hypothetical protein
VPDQREPRAPAAGADDWSFATDAEELVLSTSGETVTTVRAQPLDASGVRWVPSPKRYPGTQKGQWFFRLEPAAGRSLLARAIDADVP